MCGIVSVFGAITVAHEKMFKDMLVFDQVRGPHSTGAAFVSKTDPHATIVKQVGGALELLDSKAFDKAMATSQRVLIGHNRWATVGKINKNNAHPFQFGTITGVHNGSLTNYVDLDGYGEYEVDSQVLYHHIANNSLRDAVENCIGAMALVYWDAADETLNIYRNGERPLTFTYNEDMSVAFVASEPWMIEAAAWRHNVKLAKGPVDVASERHIKVHLPASKFSGQIGALITDEIKSKKVEYQGWMGTVGNVKSAGVNATGGATPPANVSPLRGGTVRFVSGPPHGVIATFTGEVWENNGYGWGLFLEEVDQAVARTFILPLAAIKDRNIEEGDTYQFNSSGYLKDPQSTEPKWLISATTMYLLAVNWTYNPKNQDEPEDLGPFLDNKGADIGSKEWYKRYGSCSNCSGDIDHKEKFKFNTSGGIYCVECIEDEAVASTLPR